jgi:hypothetical protein
MCKAANLCLIDEYERMNRKCKKSWLCPVGAILLTGFSAACTTFGLIGIFINTSPAQAYNILFIVGLLGDSIVIPTTIIYILGCTLRNCYTLPTKVQSALPGSATGSPKPRIKIADSSSPVEVDSPIRRASAISSPKEDASPKRKRSASR